MVDLTGISTALGSLVAAKDIAQTMVGLRDAAILNGKIAELNSKIIDAQSGVFLVNEERTALVQRVGKLEKEIADMKTWETEKQRYELKSTSQLGGFAYALKPEMAAGEPPHYICANCYQSNKKRFLQGTQNMASGRRKFDCAECHSSVPVEGPYLHAS
jgi:hypothetical protein